MTDTRPVETSDLKKAFGFGFLFVSGILVALFVQKSDGNSSIETLGAMALGGGGALLVAAGMIGLRFYRRPHNHGYRWFFSKPVLLVLSIVLGAATILFSFRIIDKSDDDFVLEPGKQKAVVDGESFALRELSVFDGENASRLLVSVINKKKSTITLDQVAVTIALEGPSSCAGNFPIFALDNKITVHDGVIEEMDATILGGSAAGFTVPITGKLVLFCDDKDLSFEFQTAITLGPQESTDLAVDFPNSFDATLSDMILYQGDKKEYPINEKEHLELSLNLTNPPPRATLSMTFELSSSTLGERACIERHEPGDNGKAFDECAPG